MGIYFEAISFVPRLGHSVSFFWLRGVSFLLLLPCLLLAAIPPNNDGILSLWSQSHKPK